MLIRKIYNMTIDIAKHHYIILLNKFYNMTIAIAKYDYADRKSL